MNNIRKKVIAILLVCTMAISFGACSDKKTNNNKEVASLNSDEISSLEKSELTFSFYTEGDNSETDSSGTNESTANDNSSSGDSAIGGNANSSSSDNNSEGSDSSNTSNGSSSEIQNPFDESSVVVGPKDDSSNESSNGSDGNSSSNTDNNNSSYDKKIIEVYWMDIRNGDYIFDGEYITATFKIRDNAPSGNYPITIEWMDFANDVPVGVKPTGINGEVTVGSGGTDNSFKDSNEFQIMAENAAGKPGDTVTVRFKMKNNPGFVACIFRFGYNNDVLEYVEGSSGKDFQAKINLNEKK